MESTEYETENKNKDTAVRNERWNYPRFFGDNDGRTGWLHGEDAKHISVLRLVRGDLVILCDNQNNDFLCKIWSVEKDLVELRILKQQKNEAAPNVEITLFQCLPKSDKMDFIVQKSTELGAVEIVPVISKRCVSRPDEKSALKKVSRWEKIALEAAKQCGGGKIPSIGKLLDFKTAVSEYSKVGQGILFYEGGGQRLNNLPLRNIEKFGVFIGSEGGFESEEAQFAENSGFFIATLGKRILRCETAPITALSVLLNLTGNI